MNKLQQLIYNDGERLVPYVTHGEGELIRHRSSYAFFHSVISKDLNGGHANPLELTIADFGFGSGYGCAILSTLPGSRIVGVDIASECETYARQYFLRSNVDYVIEDLTKFVPDARPFDYVVSRGVLEHVPNGLKLITRVQFRQRVMVDVPYNEPTGNDHHVITGIKEQEFDELKNCELFYEDIEGRIFDAENKPERPNMIMAVLSAPHLPMVSSFFKFPIEPVTDTRLEELSNIHRQGIRHYYDSPGELLGAVERAIKETEVVLDVGCGLRPMNYFRPKLHLMVEPWSQYADILSYRHSGDKSVVILRTGALEALRVISDNSVDSIFLLDVIEHLDKETGRQVILESERVAREQIVLFTPFGFMPQDVEAGQKDGWGLNGESVQQHLSGWEPEDLGAEWSFYICQSFHTHDFRGALLPEPFGAFFAIRNFGRKAAAVPATLSDFRHPLPSEVEREFAIAERERLSSELAKVVAEHERQYRQLLEAYNAVLDSRVMRVATVLKKFLLKTRTSNA